MWFSSCLGKRQHSAPSSRSHAFPRRRSSYRPRLEAFEDRWLPSQVGLTVTSLADSGPGTLRAAILTADAGSPSDRFTIGFAVKGTIDLQSPLPDLNNSIAIQGPGASSLTVERAAGFSFTSAIVTVDPGQTASLSGLTVANGTEGGIQNLGTLSISNCTVSGNSELSAPLGGGITNAVAAVLTVSDCTISNNPGEFGGGIFNEGTLTVTASTLSGNSATAEGGGIWNTGLATVSGTTISGNSASFRGGGMMTFGVVANTGAVARMTVSDSTLIGNSAPFGGGICNGAMLTVADSSTIIGNTATYGGGIFNTNFFFFEVGSVIVRDSTLTDNHATQGAGIYNTAGATLDVRGSNFTGNTASDSGGGVYNTATATVLDCTLSRNTAGSAGGGIFNGASGALAVKDSTVLHNVAPLGADLYNLGALALDDSTVGVIGP
jgi:hypothetical protein